ncbi:glycosyltransferase [Pseudotenacibaculum sp. MALMAid0570]|uniref:glycosyltransferase n=1 Tax=Pseudotenacibaculum sp. MALMAid0570 TaxID=3143938 RepID=UPI0032E02FF3
MKILFVCQQYIHSARWINQLKDSHHEVYVFDCLDREIHPDLRWTTYKENWSQRKLPYIKGEDRLRKKKPVFYEKIESYLQVTASEKLIEFIKEIQPDLIHSLEMQSETYPLLKVREKKSFRWAYSSWGSDIYHYQNNARHVKKIRNVLKQVDYFFSDNSRDISLAKNHGFSGHFMPIFPGGGGYEFQHYKKYIQPVNERKTILIKGYHHWAGRALYVLEALESILGELIKYEIYVYSAHQIVIDKIKELNTKYSLNIQYSSRNEELSHEDLLEQFGRATIAIGNSVTDGIPNTLLESIICGAFPIQSNPGGVTEDHITDGVNGLLITNPEDITEIAEKIKKALNHKELIEKAFEINQEKAKQLDYKSIKSKVLDSYKKIEEEI